MTDAEMKELTEGGPRCRCMMLTDEQLRQGAEDKALEIQQECIAKTSQYMRRRRDMQEWQENILKYPSKYVPTKLSHPEIFFKEAKIFSDDINITGNGDETKRK